MGRKCGRRRGRREVWKDEDGSEEEEVLLGAGSESRGTSCSSAMVTRRAKCEGSERRAVKAWRREGEAVMPDCIF